MKKFIFILLSIIILGQTAYASDFYDIENHWAKEYIEDAIVDGTVNGYEDQSFRPDNFVSIVEFLKLLIKSCRCEMTMANNILWPDSYIQTGLKEGFIEEGEYLDYNQKASRYEAATIISRYVGDYYAISSKIKLKDVDSEHKEVVSKLVSLKIINGFEDNTYRGENNLTRAEALVIINRAVDAKRKLTLEQSYELENMRKVYQFIFWRCYI